MATSNATPFDSPDDAPDDASGAPLSVCSDPVAEAIRAVIDPLIENEKVLAGCYAERARLLAELDRVGLQPEVLAGLRGDPVESGQNDPDTEMHGPSWDDAELARRTMAAEAAGALRLRAVTAGAMIFDATRLVHDLPGFHDSLAHGRITWGHTLKMLELSVNLPEEILPVFAARVLPAAEKLTSTQFGRVAARVLERMQPVPLQERAAVGFAKRRVVLNPDVDGMAWLSAYLKADEAQAIYDRLSRLAKNLDHDDTATHDTPGGGIDGVIGGVIGGGIGGVIGGGIGGSGIGTGTGTGADDGGRTKDQRRADAYRDLLLDGIGPNGLGHGIRGTVSITVPALTLLGRSDEAAVLDGYGPIDPESARRIAGTATSWTRILTHPETGCRLSMGREQYSPPADMRRYLQARDQTCQGIGCNRRASLSEIDHTRAWNTGGETDVDNLVHLCRPCHRLKHQSSFSTRQGPGGTLTWTSPGGKTYTSTPGENIDLPEPVPPKLRTPVQHLDDTPPPF
jgi:hypothetical protein